MKWLPFTGHPLDTRIQQLQETFQASDLGRHLSRLKDQVPRFFPKFGDEFVMEKQLGWSGNKQKNLEEWLNMKTKELWRLRNYTIIFVGAKPALERDHWSQPKLPKLIAGTDLKILRKLLVDNSTSSLKIAVQEDFFVNFWGDPC